MSLCEKFREVTENKKLMQTIVGAATVVTFFGAVDCFNEASKITNLNPIPDNLTNKVASIQTFIDQAAKEKQAGNLQGETEIFSSQGFLDAINAQAQIQTIKDADSAYEKSHKAEQVAFGLGSFGLIVFTGLLPYEFYAYNKRRKPGEKQDPPDDGLVAKDPNVQRVIKPRWDNDDF